MVPPIILFSGAKRSIIEVFNLGSRTYISKNIGASFCHVDNKRQFSQLAISIVAGYQK